MGEPVEESQVRWGMLISHHAPCDYDRTFRLAGVHICSRCFGFLIGIPAGVVIATKLPVLGLGLAWFMPLPAVADYLLHEAEIVMSSNLKRMSTGFLLGICCGTMIANLIVGDRLLGLLLLAWMFILEVLVAHMLSRIGRLEAMVCRYEQGVYK